MIEDKDLKATEDRNLKTVREKRKELSAWLRRNTCLGDDDIKRVLNEIADVAYEAGWEVGCTETMMRVQHEVARARLNRWISVIVIAACTVWLFFH